MTTAPPAKLKLFVSSSVYLSEPLLERIYAVLSGLGYEVWMSHKGTVPVRPGESAFDSCLKAVEACDVVLSLITPYYGSGTLAKGEPSITHRELMLAIERDKPMWVLAHENVVNARRLLMDLGFKGPDGRKPLELAKGAAIIEDLKLIDMYEAASRDAVPLPDRKDNWVQKYRSDEDVLLYVSKQFEHLDEVRALVEAKAAKVTSGAKA